MKKIIVLLSLLLVAGYFYSKQLSTDNKSVEISTVSELESTEATEEYVASIDGWLVGLEKAYQESKKTGKPIMANFTGSNWCGWCKRLKADVFTKAEFKKWADENVVLLEVDFPRGDIGIPNQIKQENQALQSQFGVRGYPTVWLFDVNKIEGKYSLNAYGQLSYMKNQNLFINKAKQLIAAKK